MSSDFDFLLGTWSVHHHRRTADGWVDFDSVGQARPILGGAGNVDTVVATLPDGSSFEGFTLRLYDPGAELWRIWWSSTTNPGRLDPPVEGRFHDGRGVFVGEDEIDGRPALVRFLWSDITPTSARWAQEFSFDGGSTWDPVNWIMTFTRTG